MQSFDTCLASTPFKIFSTHLRSFNHQHNMGTLTDITARASNTMKPQTKSSMGYQSLDSPISAEKPGEKENTDKSSPPHFMTPTFSSSSQSTATTHITPVSSTKSSRAETNNAWMKSAARRVSFRRPGDGTPRSKKEGPPKSSKTISFPDKVPLSLEVLPETLLTSLARASVSQ